MKTVAADRHIATLPFEPAPGSRNELFRIDRYDHDARYLRDELLVPHRKDFYFMAFVIEGHNRHWVDTSAYQVQPDTFYINNPQQVIMKEDSEPITAFAISFRTEFLDLDPSLKRLGCIVNKQGIHEIPLQPDEARFVQSLLERILQEYQMEQPLQQQMLLGYMKTLLVSLSRVYARLYGEEPPSEERSFVCRFLTRVDENFTRLHEVSEYAALMNVSPGYLGELVKEKTGKSAISQIHGRITLEGKRLLVHTDQSVKEISFLLGFEDDSYFVRFFKRNTGKTPASYRSNIREMYH